MYSSDSKSEDDNDTTLVNDSDTLPSLDSPTHLSSMTSTPSTTATQSSFNREKQDRSAIINATVNEPAKRAKKQMTLTKFTSSIQKERKTQYGKYTIYN